MKKKLFFVTASAVALITLVLLLPSVLAQTNSAPTPPAHRPADRHPHIRSAIRDLEAVKTDLQKADHDFGGHRKAALDACDAALLQLREAQKYDKK